MGDLINRQKAIEAMSRVSDSICGQQAIDELLELPSENEWIPVTEGLPELKERVLVYAEDDKSWYIAISQVLSLSSPKGCFLGFNGTQKVKAWMPLPDPYEGGDAE